MGVLADDLLARIAAIDAEMTRVAAGAQQQIAQLKADRAVLLTAQAVLAKVPEAEQLLPALRKLGAI